MPNSRACTLNSHTHLALYTISISYQSVLLYFIIPFMMHLYFSLSSTMITSVIWKVGIDFKFKTISIFLTSEIGYHMAIKRMVPCDDKYNI